MSETSLQETAKEIYTKHEKVVESWVQSSDPIKNALACAVKHFAGVEMPTSHS